MMAWLARLVHAENGAETTAADESRARYMAALAQLREATVEMRRLSSSSLNALERRVTDADALMHEAFTRRSVDGR